MALLINNGRFGIGLTWGLTQKELAEALAITRVRLSEVLRGKKRDHPGYGLSPGPVL